MSKIWTTWVTQNKILLIILYYITHFALHYIVEYKVHDAITDKTTHQLQLLTLPTVTWMVDSRDDEINI